MTVPTEPGPARLRYGERPSAREPWINVNLYKDSDYLLTRVDEGRPMIVRYPDGAASHWAEAREWTREGELCPGVGGVA